MSRPQPNGQPSSASDFADQFAAVLMAAGLWHEIVSRDSRIIHIFVLFQKAGILGDVRVHPCWHCRVLHTHFLEVIRLVTPYPQYISIFQHIKSVIWTNASFFARI